jgi:hypothetical protein
MAETPCIFHPFYCSQASDGDPCPAIMSDSSNILPRILQDQIGGMSHISISIINVSYYRVIEDARLGASLISIYKRRATSERVTYLIFGWGPMPLIQDVR